MIGNIHGHLHANEVQVACPGGTHRDNLYFNACVEQMDYTPRSIESIAEQRGWS